MSEMPRQLAFDWPPRVAMGAESYFVSDSNRDAYALVTEPARWPEGKLVLTGPPGAGKTHLARLFAARTGAEILEAPRLAPGSALAEGAAVVIENGDALRPEAQEWLFHLHNALAARGGLLLVTARSAPARWPLTLPDLASRLQAAPVARLHDPDDTLLEAVLHKLFEDRQIVPDARLVPYLVRRIDRSLAAAAGVVDRLDRAAMGAGRPVGVALAARVLDTGDGPA